MIVVEGLYKCVIAIERYRYYRYRMRGVLQAQQGILLRINHSFSNITDIEKVSKGDERGS